MRVTMVGVSGSGKTSYMAAMHEALASTNKSGFTIRTTLDETAPLEANIAEVGRFEAISFNNMNYNWPPGTVKTTLWDFDLYHNMEKITKFQWIDYRGGILTDALSGKANEGETEELLQHIYLSNAVIMVADAYILTHYENLNEARKRSGAHTINKIFQTYNAVYPNHDLVYILMLTKSDTIAPQWKENNYEPLMQRGLDAFDEIVTLTKHNPNWVGGIVHVSAVGEGHAERTVLDPGDLQTPVQTQDKIVTYPEPRNAEHVIFFSLGEALEKMKKVAQQSAEKREDQIRESLQKTGLVNNFWSWVTGKSSYKEVAETLMEQQKEDYELLKQLEAYIEPLRTTAAQQVKRIK